MGDQGFVNQTIWKRNLKKLANDFDILINFSLKIMQSCFHLKKFKLILRELSVIKQFLMISVLTVSGSVFLILVMWNVGSRGRPVSEFGLDGCGPSQSDL